ncbi:MAG: exopolyphosphatase [Thermodesulfobacteriota bacterium]
MRIVTRPDFDGIACAVLLHEALAIQEPVTWVEPNDMQKGRVVIQPGDVIANLPYHPACSLWFDHHFSNRIDTPFQGEYRIAPSAAGIVFDYYKERFKKDFGELAAAADKIDSADLSSDEVLQPEKYPYILVSMTVKGHQKEDEPYWNTLVDLFREQELSDICGHGEVQARCQAVIRENRLFGEILQRHTTVDRHVSITDLRSFDRAPSGNRFLVYSLFPQAVVSVKIRYDDRNREKIIVSVGHSIFNRNCRVNVGKMLSAFEGGGHRGAGACSFHYSKADDYINEIVEILLRNEPNDP